MNRNIQSFKVLTKNILNKTENKKKSIKLENSGENKKRKPLKLENPQVKKNKIGGNSNYFRYRTLSKKKQSNKKQI